jgi:hypothetical protein
MITITSNMWSKYPGLWWRYSDDPECELFNSICGHSWDNGVLMLRIKWKTDEESVMAFTMVKQDYPYETAEYILQNKVGTSEHKYETGHYIRWACAYMQQCKQTLHHIIWLSGGDIIWEDDVKDSPIIPTDSSPNGNPLLIWCTNALNTTNKKRAGKRKKPGQINQPVQVKYCVLIPRSVKHAKELDTKNGNRLWANP